jgi:hypothetical protein
MKTHVDFAHYRLVAKKKLLLTKKFRVKHVDLNHSQQNRKKNVRPYGLTFITFFVQQIFTNMVMNHNKDFLKTLCFIFAKGIGLFSHVKTSNYVT